MRKFDKSKGQGWVGWLQTLTLTEGREEKKLSSPELAFGQASFLNPNPKVQAEKFHQVQKPNPSMWKKNLPSSESVDLQRRLSNLGGPDKGLINLIPVWERGWGERKVLRTAVLRGF